MLLFYDSFEISCGKKFLAAEKKTLKTLPLIISLLFLFWFLSDYEITTICFFLITKPTETLTIKRSAVNDSREKRLYNSIYNCNFRLFCVCFTRKKCKYLFFLIASLFLMIPFNKQFAAPIVNYFHFFHKKYLKIIFQHSQKSKLSAGAY